MTLVKTDLGFLHIIHRFKIVGRETNNNKGSIKAYEDDLKSRDRIFTDSQLKKLYPKIDESVLKDIFGYIEEYRISFGLDNCSELIHFLTQADHESGGFGSMKEKEEFSGDREKYKGRGIFQLTFQSNYRAFQDFLEGMDIKVDLIKNPDIVEESKYAVLSALWYWKANNLSSYSNDLTEESLLKVSKIVNCGNLEYCGCEKDEKGHCKLDSNKRIIKCTDCAPNGWEDRKNRFVKFKNQITCK